MYTHVKFRGFSSKTNPKIYPMPTQVESLRYMYLAEIKLINSLVLHVCSLSLHPFQDMNNEILLSHKISRQLINMHAFYTYVLVVE